MRQGIMRPVQLLLCIIISSASCFPQLQPQEDLCTTYTEDYVCPADPGRNIQESSSSIKEIPSCSENLVDATLALIDLGKELIELTDGEEAVMLIGTTGTGKTTLTYFLAGDNTKLIAYKKGTGNYLIKDCNGKISGNSTIVSTTVFPELVTESTTNTAFYDNPGFSDTRDSCTEIASAYSIRMIAEHVKQLKILLVINEPSLKPGHSRTDLIVLLNSVIKFLPNIEKYGKGLGLIGTKLKFDAGEENENNYMADAKTFLSDNRDALKNVTFDDPNGLRKAQFIVDTLINADEPNKMGLFRAPVSCGPMSDLPHMQDNKKNMTTMIHQNLQYVASSPDDFGYSLSSTAQLAIGTISTELSQRAITSLQDLTPILSSNKLEELHPLGVYEKRESLKSYKSELEGAGTSLESEFQNGSIKTHVFIQNLLDKFVQLGLPNAVAQNYSSSLLGPFEFFDSVGYPSSINIVNVGTWLKSLTNFQSQISKEEKWNDFLISLWTDLSQIDYQSFAIGNGADLKKWWQAGNNKITLSTFSSFWDRFIKVSAIYNRDKAEFTGILGTDTADKLKNLNDLLSTSLGKAVNCELTSSNTVTTVTGNFVTVSDIVTNTSCVKQGVTKTVKVFAAHTIFIDQEFIASGINGANGVDLTIISPNLWYFATNTINLDGGTGLPGDSAGGPGKPGGRAGNLISISQKFTGTVRNSAVGGRGGNGAAGAKGQDGAMGRRLAYFEDDDDNDDEYWYPPKGECEAESGKIQLQSYYTQFGYWCDEPEDQVGWCHASSYAIYKIYGESGTQGSDGGNGGQSGLGGKGGHLYKIQVESGLKEDPPGVDGSRGEQGVGGAAGRGGFKGDQLYAQIDDVQRNGEKWCKVLMQEHRSSGEQARDGNTGITGASSTSPDQPIPQSFSLDSVATYFSQFKSSVIPVESNQFLSSIITEFNTKGDQALRSIF